MANSKILIVDDEPFNVDYLEQELEELNYETISAENGQEALDKVQSESPDLILLDIMMPIMDGFEALSRLKADKDKRDIPVIVISASNDLRSVVKGIQLGAEDYLPKPFEPTLLHARISSSLEKKRLTDETQQRNSELSILNSVGEAMAKTLDVKTVTRIVGDKVRDIFSADQIGILLFEQQTNLIHLAYGYDKAHDRYVDDIQIKPIPLGKGLTSKVIELRQPLLLSTREEQNAHGHYLPPELKGQIKTSESWLGVPIMVGEDVLGVVMVENYRPHMYNENNLRLLQTLSSNMGVAIQNARLFEETQQRNAELAVINEIGQGLARELNFQAIIDLVGDKVRDIFSAQATMIFLYNAATNILSYPYFHKHGQRFHSDSRQINPQMDPGFLALIIRTQQRVVINQDLEQEMLKIGESLMSDTTMFESMAYVPIFAGDQVIGVLGLESKDKNAFPVLAVNLLTTIAANLGVALENARLFDETQLLLKETEDRAAELAIINRVQEGLASKLEMQSIYQLIGEKVREVFKAHVIDIVDYDPINNLISMPYSYEKGDLSVIEPCQPYGFRQQVIETCAPLLVNQNFIELAAQYNNPLLTGTWPKSALFVPLLVDGRVRSIISIQDLDSENAYSASDVQLLQTLSNAMSVALENARLLEAEKMFRKALQRELDIGREIQQGFLPEALPRVEGWEIAASLMSAREVAGDFYDAFILPDGTLGLVIADVCDKGVGAALFMTLFRSLIRAAANLDYFEQTENANAPHSPVERLQRAISLTNNYIAETHGESGMFATIFFGILNPRDGKLIYINGGHEAPLIVRAGAARESLHRTGPAVGVLTNARFEQAETQLHAGDTIFAFTDGVPDSQNPRGEFFGRERLLEILHGNHSADETVNVVQSELRQYIAGANQFDDITLLAVRHVN